MSSSIETGLSDIRGVYRLAWLDGNERVLALAGSTLQCVSTDGRSLWSRADLNVSRIVCIHDEPGGPGWAAVVSGTRQVLLIYTASGDLFGALDTDTRYSVAGNGSVLPFELEGRRYIAVAPVYDRWVTLFEINHQGPRVAWRLDLGDKIDLGFGPVMVLSRGHRPELLLSSRRGESFVDDSQEKLVLGRDGGRVFQCAVDIGTGEIVREGSHAPEPGGYPAARPYGLMEALPDTFEGTGSLVLASCQVEEYVTVTDTRTFQPRWSWFVEKDWPDDQQELRPHTSSVADVLGLGRPQLIVSHWSNGRWRTRVLDVLSADPGGDPVEIEGAYCWGVIHSADDAPLLVISRLDRRDRGGAHDVDAVDASTGVTRGSLVNVVPVISTDDELPPYRRFHADRSGVARLRHRNGREGVVVTRDDGVGIWWSPGSTGEQFAILTSEPVARVDDREGRSSVTDVSGLITLLDPNLHPAGTLRVPGCNAEVLLALDAATALIVASAGESIRVFEARFGTHITTFHGHAPSLRRAAEGVWELACAKRVGRGEVIEIWQLSREHNVRTMTWSTSGTVDSLRLLAGGDVLATIKDGPHSTSTSVFSRGGGIRWSDDQHGAHASAPLVIEEGSDRWLVVDDHGLLRLRAL
ncbi:hypothetical protein, partial [Aphanothece microscopica]|uniref:hypothetical protein n=1 Tax=Aphanothece microscopica TaxID=1049561 RepID=UPI003CE4A030